MNDIPLCVAFRSPKPQGTVMDKVGAPFEPDEATIGQRAHLRLVSDFLPSVADPRRVQFQIHLVGIRQLSLTFTTSPRLLESVEPFTAALGTWSVPGGERHGLVEEEQLRVAPLGHHDSVPPSKFQNARNPAPAFETARDLAIAVVDRTAAVAHHRPASVCAK